MGFIENTRNSYIKVKACLGVHCSTPQFHFSVGYSYSWGRGWVLAMRRHHGWRLARQWKWKLLTPPRTSPNLAVWREDGHGECVGWSNIATLTNPEMQEQMYKTTPSVVNLKSPWRNARRGGCRYGSHAVSIMTIWLQVLSSSCHSEVRNSQQLQQNSFNSSEFCFNAAKMLLQKMPMTRHIFHTLVNNRSCIRFQHQWNRRRKCRLVGNEVKSPLSQISSKPPHSHIHHLQLLVATVTFSQQLCCQHLAAEREAPFLKDPTVTSCQLDFIQLIRPFSPTIHPVSHSLHTLLTQPKSHQPGYK